MWLPPLFLAAICVVFGIFAYRLPLKYLILPVLNNTAVFSGTWWAGAAAVLLGSGLFLGVIIYLATSARKVREAPTYIGGEVLDQVYVSGTSAGNGRNIEVTGVDFYLTIQDFGPLKGIFKIAGKKLFDLYDVSTGIIFYFVEALRKAHSGLLPLYLSWIVGGLLIVLWLLVVKG